MNLLIVSPTVVVSEFGASVSPSRYVQTTSNGAFTTLKFKAVAENYTGDLSYTWTFTKVSSQSASIQINSPTSSETTMTISSFNSNIDIILKCDITDDNETISAVSSLDIQFGIGGIEP